MSGRSHTLGVDPGKAKGLAYALVRADIKQLMRCGVVNASTIDAQAAQLIERLEGYGAAELHVVCELPIWHAPKPSDRRFINPNDLIDLAASAGVAVGTFASRGSSTEFVRPNIWKGQRPKDVHNRYIEGLLSAEEAKVLQACGTTKALRNDVLDAIGIAFWKVGRR